MILSDISLKTYTKAVQNFKKASFGEALRQLRYCISQDYEIKESYAYTGIYHYYQLQFHEAFIYLQMVVSSDNHHSAAYYYLGVMCEELGNIQDALGYYKKSVDYATDSLFPLISLIAIKPYLTVDEALIYKDKAFQTFTIQLDITQQEKQLIQAFQYWALEDYTQAEDLFKQAIQIEAENFEPYIFLAQFYFYQKNYEQSKNYWLLVDRKFDLIRIGLKYLTKIEAEGTNYKKAIQYFRSYLEFSKNTGYKEYFNLANLYSLASSPQRAIFFYEKAVALNAQFFPALFNLGVCFQKMGHFEQAIFFYERASSVDGHNAQIFYNLGLIYFEQKDYIQSLFNLNKAFQLDPGFQEAQDNFYYISYLHILTDKGFSRDNYSLVAITVVVLIIILIALTVLHFVGLI